MTPPSNEESQKSVLTRSLPLRYFLAIVLTAACLAVAAGYAVWQDMNSQRESADEMKRATDEAEQLLEGSQ